MPPHKGFKGDWDATAQRFQGLIGRPPHKGFKGDWDATAERFQG